MQPLFLIPLSSSQDPYSPESPRCQLSVNINKVATLRNSRGGSMPDVREAARRCQSFGAQGITVHPRPDERHITRRDAHDLRQDVHTEYNIEGYPSEAFIAMVLEIRPEQVTLVPDGPDVLTSDAGWDALTQADFLKPIVARFRDAGIRCSLFMDTDVAQLDALVEVAPDRIELYTEAYAHGYADDREAAVAPYREAAAHAHGLGFGINAGHDLSLENLRYFVAEVPHLEEVSIGHALISDALYMGLENTVQQYRYQIELGWADQRQKEVTS